MNILSPTEMGPGAAVEGGAVVSNSWKEMSKNTAGLNLINHFGGSTVASRFAQN